MTFATKIIIQTLYPFALFQSNIILNEVLGYSSYSEKSNSKSWESHDPSISGG